MVLGNLLEHCSLNLILNTSIFLFFKKIFFNLQSTSASASASPFQSTWYSESEITQGARSRSQNQQRDHDSKRPKLSCTNCTSTSAGRSVGHGLNSVSGKN